MEKILGIKHSADVIIKAKTKKRMNRILLFYCTQFVLMQYGTYSAFSWDIMEPIACCLEAFDLIIGYVFWMTTHREMNLEDIAENYTSKRSYPVYQKLGFDVDKY